MNNKTPVILGLKKSFGFGDRLGLAGPGHISALRGSGFAGILAQQSIREMTRTRRTPEEVIEAAVSAVEACGYAEPWGADADHLKNEDDIKATLKAGFCFFTIDPSEYVNNGADAMAEDALAAENSKLVREAVFADADWMDSYLGRDWDLGTGNPLRYDKESLLRAAVKYGRAIAHCGRMASWIAQHAGDKLFEIEVSVDETDSPTSHLEHLFFATELKRRGVTVVSLAPRFIGEFEKGIDYKGDLAAFEASLETHVAIARAMGPYKISIHSGSDKFSIYPVIGRCCGELLHVKTAGTSYLEALRVVLKAKPALFREIAAYSSSRFGEDRASYHISTTDADVSALAGTIDADMEDAYLEQNSGRQLLHVTFGSVLTLGKTAAGQSFKEAIMETLQAHPDLHEEVLVKHLGKHLRLLAAG